MFVVVAQSKGTLSLPDDLQFRQRIACIFTFSAASDLSVKTMKTNNVV